MNTSNGSYRAPPVRRWMSDLAKQLREVLQNDYDYTSGNEVSPEISKKILSLMPEATSVADRQEAVMLRTKGRGLRDSSYRGYGSSVINKERKIVDTSGSADLNSVSGNDEEVVLVIEEAETAIDTVSDSKEEREVEADEEVEIETVPTVYDAELAAILSHYQTSKALVEQNDAGNKTEVEAITANTTSQAIHQKEKEGHVDLSINTEQHLSSFSSSPNSNWRPKIGEGSLMLLVRLIADSSTPQAALQLYRILDAAAYPTRTPRFLSSMVGLLVKKNCPEAAAALLREAVLAEKRAETTATAGSSSSSSICPPTSHVSTYRGGSLTSGNYNGSGIGKFSDAWASLSRSGRPEIVQGLIKDLERAGIPADTDAYVCSIRVHARARDTPAAIACFEEMRKQGIERSSSIFASLAKAAADGGDIQLAMKVLYWAEEDAKDNPSLKLTSVWRELLMMSCNENENEKATAGLRSKLLGRLEKQARHLPCDVIDKVVVGAAESGQIVGAIDVFSKLRSKGLISGIPVAVSGNSSAGALGGSRVGELNISGMEYEQVILDSPNGNIVEEPIKRRSSPGNKTQDFKNKFIASTANVAMTSLTDTDTDSDAEDSLDIMSGYSDTEIDGEEVEEELLPETGNSNTTGTHRPSTPSRGFRSRKGSTAGPSSPDAAQSLYTSLILGAHKARLDEPMKQLYTWLHEDGLLPNRLIMTRMAACLPYANDPAGAFQLYGYIRELNIPMDGFMYGHIIAALLVGPQGHDWWDTALLLTHRMHMAVPSSHDTSVQTSMVVNAGKNGWVAELLALYNLMLQDGVIPRPITWNAFITAAMRCNRPDLGFAFGVAMRKMGCSMDAATHSALFSCAAAQGDAEAAQKQWKAMLEDNIAPDCIACTSYMWACLCGGKAERAIEFFESWRKDRKPPGWHDNLTSGRAAAAGGGSVTTSAAPTFSEVCTALLKGGRWDQSRTALQLQRWIKGQGEDPRSINLDQLRARGVARGGRWAQASALADEAVRTPAPVKPPEPDSVSISFAATGYAQLGNQAKALQLADELSSMDIPLHSIAFSTALDGCAAAGALDAALKLLRRARIAGIRPDPAAYGAAISAAAPQGNISAALMVLNWMVEDGVRPNIIAVNSALAVCAAANDAEAALAVFWRMKAEWGIDPDPIAYATLCEVLTRAGRWGDAARAILVCEHTLEAIYKRMSLLKLCDTDPPKINIDLHGLSVAAASTAVRAWLLALRRSSAVTSGKIDGEQVTIVTGRGRNSLEGVSKLKPGIELLFNKGLGGKRILNFTTPPENPGKLFISGADLRAGLEDFELDLGFGIKEEEDEIWKLLTGRAVPTIDVIPRAKPKP